MNHYPAQFEEAMRKNNAVMLSAKCEVWYSGQVESYLPLGDRLILIKDDGVMVVHQPQGNNPINYLKPGATYSMTAMDGHIFLNGNNIKLKEYMDVKIQKIHLLCGSKLALYYDIGLKKLGFSDKLQTYSSQLVDEAVIRAHYKINNQQELSHD